MDCLNAAPEGIIIHDIIMDKGKRVREFERERSLYYIRRTSPFYRIGSKHDNCRAESFAPGREKVSTRFVQFANLVNKIPVDHTVDLLRNRFQVR
jgi:hypothetical protein